MLGSRHEIARLQSDFYRDQFRRTLRWLMYAFALMLVLILGIIYVTLSQPGQEYYANTSEGLILTMPKGR